MTSNENETSTEPKTHNSVKKRKPSRKVTRNFTNGKTKVADKTSPKRKRKVTNKAKPGTTRKGLLQQTMSERKVAYET